MKRDTQNDAEMEKRKNYETLPSNIILIIEQNSLEFLNKINLRIFKVQKKHCFEEKRTKEGCHKRTEKKEQSTTH